MSLLDYLLATFSSVPPEDLRRSVEEGRFQLQGGDVLEAHSTLHAGQTILASVPHRGVEDPWLPPPPSSLDVLVLDKDIVIVDKPPGLLSYPLGPRRASVLSVFAAQLAREGADNELRPAHRLDRETSGALMMTRHLEADRRIKKAFVDKKIGKSYVAIVRGELQEAQVVEAPIGPDKGGAIRIRMAVRDDGRPASTELKPLQTFGRGERRWTWVEARPLTGRTHQIRLHLAHAGHPIVGDKIYCDEGLAFLRWWDGKLGDEDLARLELPRHALHARTLRLEHPMTGEALDIKAPIPQDLLDFAQQHGGRAP